MAFGKKLNRFFNKNSGWLLAIGAVGTVAAFAVPLQDGETAAQKAAESDPVLDALNLLGLVENATATGVWHVYVKYDQGQLTELAKYQVAGAKGEFDATGTSQSGNQAKFVLKCGDDACGQVIDRYEDPASFWIVTVPMRPDLSTMTVTAGTSILEVRFA